MINIKNKNKIIILKKKKKKMKKKERNSCKNPQTVTQKCS